MAACAVGPQPEAVSALAPQADPELRTLIDGAPDLVIAGERLNVALLRRFYARHGFEPVWTTRPAQAASLVNAILHAGDQGLDPELFHASLLQNEAAAAPLDHELLLSDAFLSYASALAFGAVPVERRRDDEALTPKPIDVAAALDVAIHSPDPAAVMDALAPTTPTYQGLRQALQQYRLGASADEKPTADHLRKIAVNLERQRWLPRPLPADRVWVNAAEEQVVLYRANQAIFSTRVIVGEDIVRNQTPEFSTMVEASWFNPPWVIPRDIVSREILPNIAKDPNYLTKNNMVMLANGEAEQLPGPEAGLGLMMFDMPNRFDVYLHDTPEKDLFDRANRRISHGCIRVQNPRELAALLLQQPVEAIDQGIAMGGTTRHELPTPIPVFVVYQTASVDTGGRLQFYPDFYNRDAEIWQKLHRRPQGQDHGAQADLSPTSPQPLRRNLRPAMSAPPERPTHRPRNAMAASTAQPRRMLHAPLGSIARASDGRVKPGHHEITPRLRPFREPARLGRTAPRR